MGLQPMGLLLSTEAHELKTVNERPFSITGHGQLSRKPLTGSRIISRRADQFENTTFKSRTSVRKKIEKVHRQVSGHFPWDFSANLIKKYFSRYLIEKTAKAFFSFLTLPKFTFYNQFVIFILHFATRKLQYHAYALRQMDVTSREGRSQQYLPRYGAKTQRRPFILISNAPAGLRGKHKSTRDKEET